MNRYWICLMGAALLSGCSPAEPKSTTPASDSAASKPETEPATELKALPEDAPEMTLEEGFQPLGFADFASFSAKAPGKAVVWEAAGNGFNCYGKPRGYLYSKSAYGSFTLKLDYRFRRPQDLKADADFKGNTGVMIFITEPHKQWPVSLEVQGKYSEMATIKANGGAKDVVIKDDSSARESARKPVGEWNSLEITAKDGGLSAAINGKVVCESEAGELKSGLLGFQAEDFEVQFRNIRIKAE